MASSLVQEGSPLDDYLRDQDTSEFPDGDGGRPSERDRTGDGLGDRILGVESPGEPRIDEAWIGPHTVSSVETIGGDGLQPGSGNPRRSGAWAGKQGDTSAQDVGGVGSQQATRDPQEDERWTGPRTIPSGPSRPAQSQRFTSTSTSAPSSPTKFAGFEDRQTGSSGDQLSLDAAEVPAALAFAERFKYLVCSSGLLEKDWMPGLGGRQGLGMGEGGQTPRDAVEDGQTPEEVEIRDEDPEDGIPGPSRGESTTLGAIDVAVVGELLRKRWDIALAGAVLVVAVAIVLGVLVTAAGVLSAAVLALLWRSRVSGPFSTAEMSESPASDHRGGAEAGTISPAASPPGPGDLTLSAVSALLSTSRQYDSILSSSLSLLCSQPDALSSHRDLRLAIHRLCNNSTDHLAAATSSLLELVDRNGLGVLGEMYDIPMGGGSSRSQIPLGLGGSSALFNATDESSASDEVTPASTRLLGGVPSPKRPPRRSNRSRLSLLSPTPKHASLPFTPPRQLPTAPDAATSRPRTRHTAHLSLTPSLSPSRPYSQSDTDTEDRFTALPLRTPRLSKRASWDQQAWEAARNEGLRGDWKSQTGAGAGTRRSIAKRPVHDRRITEAEEDEQEMDASSEGSRATSPMIGAGANASPSGSASDSPSVGGIPIPVQSRAPFTPRRASPLAPRPLTPRFGDALLSMYPAPPRLSSASTALTSSSVPTSAHGLLPSPIALEIGIPRSLSAVPTGLLGKAPAPVPPASANPKRRSLQSLPYYPSDDEGLDHPLSRSLSGPTSDLQALRTRDATGSKRSSIHSIHSIQPHPLASNNLLQSPIGIARTFPPDSHRNFSPVRSPVVPVLSPIPRTRITSLNPLTLPALQASCLGVHLKRRKVACCLLGLRFDLAGTGRGTLREAYWDDVRGTLEELRERLEAEREMLAEALVEAERSERAREMLAGDQPSRIGEVSGADMGGSRPVWVNIIENGKQGYVGPGELDFAPRTTDEQRLLDLLGNMQSALTRAWNDTEAVRESLTDRHLGAGGDIKALDAPLQWARLRGGLGHMIREWDRGRDVVSRLSAESANASASASDAIHEPADQSHTAAAEAKDGAAVRDEGVPEFLRAWEEDGADGETAGSTSLDTANTSGFSEPAELDPDERENRGLLEQMSDGRTDFLPPPGVDEVYEADSTFGQEGYRVVMRGLSRDERIRLTKEARAKGVSVERLLEEEGRGEGGGGADGGVVNEQEREREVRMRGGEVVHELKGMIGMIRRRKGHGMDVDERSAEEMADGRDDVNMEEEAKTAELSQRSRGVQWARTSEAGREVVDFDRSSTAGLVSLPPLSSHLDGQDEGVSKSVFGGGTGLSQVDELRRALALALPERKGGEGEEGDESANLEVE